MYTDMDFKEVGYGHDYSSAPLDELGWESVVDADILFDNVAVAPTGP